MASGQAKSRGGIFTWAKAIFTFPVLQGALQLVAGAFIVALFTLVRAMKFPLACTAMTLYLVMSVLVPQDNHFGSKLLGSCLVVGAGATGAVIAGSLASIAKTIDYNPYTGHDRSDFYSYNALYMCLSAIGLAILCVNRVGADPPFLWAVGMISCLAFGIVMNNGQFVPPSVPPQFDTYGNPIRFFWTNVVGRVLLDFVIAQGTVVLAALTIMPTFASVELRGQVAKALTGIGRSMSKYSSKLLEPEDPYCLYVPPSKSSANLRTTGAASAISKAKGGEGGGGGDAIPVAYDGSTDPSVAEELGLNADPPPEEDLGEAIFGESILEDEEVDEETVRKWFNELAKPIPPPLTGHAAAPPSLLRLGPPVASYRALLGRARALLPFSIVEPPFITRYPFHSDAWGRVIGTCEALLSRIAGLEVVVEERRQVLGESTLICHFTVNIAPILRLVFAEVSASCAMLSRSLDPDVAENRRPVGWCMQWFGRSWQDTRAQLRATMAESMRGYLGRVRGDLLAAKQSMGALPHSPSNVKDSTAQTPAAAGTTGANDGQSTEPTEAAKDGGAENGGSKVVVGERNPYTREASKGKRVHIMDATRMRAILYVFSLTMGIIDAMEDVEKAIYALQVKTYGPYAKPAAPAEAASAASKPDVEQGAAKPDTPPHTTTPTPTPPAPKGPRMSKDDVPVTKSENGAQKNETGDKKGDHAHKENLSKGTMAGTAPPAAPGAKPPPPPGVLWAVMCMTLQLGAPVWGGLAHFFVHDLRDVFKTGGISRALRSRTLQTYVKYYACLLLVLMLIQGLSARDDTKDVRTYRPGIAFNAAALAMSEKVEATVSKAVLWVIGTAVGGTLGFIVMVDNDLATNPYGLMAILCAFTFVVGSMSGHQTYATRMLAVMMGALLATIIANTILPWYNSDWCLETLGQSFVEMHKVLTAAYTQYYHEGQQAMIKTQSFSNTVAALATTADTDTGAPPAKTGDNEDASGASGSVSGDSSSSSTTGANDASIKGPGLIGMPQGPPLSQLQAKIAGPLTQVQISLVKDAAVWQRGLLATPPLVPRLLQQEYALLDRLSALVVMLRPGVITGTFSGSAFKNIVVPLHPQMNVVVKALGKVVTLTNTILAGDRTPAAVSALQTALTDLGEERLKARQIIIALRRKFHFSLVDCADDNVPYLNDPDDLVRVLSFMHAIIKLCDKAIQVAALAGTAPPCNHFFGWDWLK